MDSSNNNNDKSLDRTPTMRDLIELLKNTSSKEDIDDIKNQITEYRDEQRAKISTIQDGLANVTETSSNNRDRIAALESTVEMLKQDKLRNNICISGLPLSWGGDSVKCIIMIAGILGININPNDFSSYTTASGKLIIASFYNYNHKQSIIRKLRVKRSLMAEEVFTAIKSNNQLYINDHLTPYFSHLFQMARNAKKNGFLASATSSGGRIRVRKHFDDAPTLISTETQLTMIIELEIDTESTSNMSSASTCCPGTSIEDKNNNTKAASVATKSNKSIKPKGKPSGPLSARRKRGFPDAVNGDFHPNKRNKN